MPKFGFGIYIDTCNCEEAGILKSKYSISDLSPCQLVKQSEVDYALHVESEDYSARFAIRRLCTVTHCILMQGARQLELFPVPCARKAMWRLASFQWLPSSVGLPFLVAPK